MVQPYNLMANYLCKVSSQQVYHYQTICDGAMTGNPCCCAQSLLCNFALAEKKTIFVEN